MDFIKTIIDNYASIGTAVLAFVGGAVTLATVIVKLTPTTKDDEFLGKVVSFLEKASVLKKSSSTDAK